MITRAPRRKQEDQSIVDVMTKQKLGPGAKEGGCKWFLQAEKCKDLQNSKRIYWCCFNPLSL